MFRDDDFGLLDLLEIALGFPGACLGEAGVQCAEDLRCTAVQRYSRYLRLRPPRCMSQRLNATEATTTMPSTMPVVVIAPIYR